MNLPALLRMHTRRVIATVTLLSCIATTAAIAQDNGTPADTPRAWRVMFVGNSLTYVNNLPALLRAVAASQGVSITTESHAAPGGTLAERWREGHVADALRTRKFDIVLLQEQGGHLAACMASASKERTAPCAASLRAYREIAELASKRGARTLLFQTWGPNEGWQARLDRSLQAIATRTSASIFDAAGALQALNEADPDIELFPDGTHPSTQASLMLALALYRDITGTVPVAKDLRVSAPLLPVNAAVSPAAPIESQPGLAGDGKVTVVPAALLAPLIDALPDKQGEDAAP